MVWPVKLYNITVIIFKKIFLQQFVIAVMQWNSGNLLHVGWSNVEDLVCVQDDGSVLIYDMFGTFKRTLTMGQVPLVFNLLVSEWCNIA